MSIPEAAASYRSIMDMLHRFEALLQKNNFAEIIALFPAFVEEQKVAMELMESIKNARGKPELGDAQTKKAEIELLELMRQVYRSNRRLTPKIRRLAALKKQEQRKICQGSVVMQKYHSKTDRTGRLLSGAG